MFLSWLLEQAHRQDQIGHLARVNQKENPFHQVLLTTGGKNTLKKYASMLPKGRLSRSLCSAIGEWIDGAHEPLVGIFWLIDDQIVDFAMDASSVLAVHGFKDYPQGHVKMWPFVQRLYPDLQQVEYEMRLRGRVLGVGSRFRILVSPKDTLVIRYWCGGSWRRSIYRQS